jgi:hypothetical protein
LEDDIIDWETFEPEIDRFCKLSIMEGLKFIARRNKIYPDDMAARIFEKL